MSAFAWSQWLLFLGMLFVLAIPAGFWLARIGEGRLPAWMLSLEAVILRLCGVGGAEGMGWRQYAVALLIFNGLGVLTVYGLLRLQDWLPANPLGYAGLTPDLAFNTAVSFVTNTNWQSYAGEATMSHLSQMLALTVQNFLSAATGIAVAFALIRGFVRREASELGNFWQDSLRITLWVLLPGAFLFALFLMGQGVVQNFTGATDAQLLEPVRYSEPVTDARGQPVLGTDGKPAMQEKTATVQQVAQGPVASQVAIKMLGTNGGGYMNANAAHPFENPTPLSNWLQMLSIFLIPAGLCVAFGKMVGDHRQGAALLAAMTLLFLAGVLATTVAEQSGHPQWSALGIDFAASDLQSGGNMEGKETRFGIVSSALFAVITTAASCGAVNAMHDSFTPLGGMVPMLMIQLGEVVFGGVGAGLYGMLIFVLLTVFLSGLMIGRTPEYLGKKIEAPEMKLVAISLLITPALILIGTATALMLSEGLAGLSNPGPHGLSQVLYAYSSAANNNGSAFAGLSANSPFFNVTLAIAMWLGRFGVIFPVLAVAGSMAAKKKIEPSAGTLPTTGPLFVVLLAGTVLIVGALTYVPALALGPLAEHFLIWGRP